MNKFYMIHLKNITLTWPRKFQSSDNRPQIVESLFRMIEMNPAVFTPVSANGEVVTFKSPTVVSFRFAVSDAPADQAPDWEEWCLRRWHALGYNEEDQINSLAQMSQEERKQLRLELLRFDPLLIEPYLEKMNKVETE